MAADRAVRVAIVARAVTVVHVATGIADLADPGTDSGFHLKTNEAGPLWTGFFVPGKPLDRLV